MMDRTVVQDRRRERDRLAASARRQAARDAGEPLGHGLDGLLVDGLALLLAGRDPDDPVRVAYQRALAKAFRARRVAATPTVARRLQARLAIGSSLTHAMQSAIAESA